MACSPTLLVPPRGIVLTKIPPLGIPVKTGYPDLVRRRSWLNDLQRQLLLWAGVVTVALSLLAMHQLSGGHTAADPMPPTATQPDRLGGHTTAYVASSDHAHSADHARSQLRAGATTLKSESSAPIDDGCPGCAEHQAMALTCLIALTLLAVGWLLAGPVRWPGLVPRPRAQTLSQDRWRRRHPPALRLVELSVSRT